MDVAAKAWVTDSVPILTQSENWALLTISKAVSNYAQVPILTQSENWALFHHLAIFERQTLVPILTQSENWALEWLPVAIAYQIALFQSSPSPKTGRYQSLAHSQLAAMQFQSSPSPKTGRYPCESVEYDPAIAVPILTQSENWAL